MSDSAEAAPMGRRDLIWSYVIVIATITATGVMLGLTLPLLSLILDSKGMSATFIGFSNATPGLATFAVAPFIPAATKRFGTVTVMLVCVAASVACFLLYLVITDPWAWFPIRFVHGAAHAVLFILSEFWVTVLAPPRIRGRVLGIYGTILSSGFASGPFILSLAGSEGALPFLIGAGLMVVAGIPLLIALGRAGPGLAPVIAEKPAKPLWGYLWLAPAATLAAFVFGALETGVFQLLPVYGLDKGLDVTDAALLLSIVGLGYMLMQFPLGFLADFVDKRLVLLGCGLAAFSGALVLPGLMTDPVWSWPVLFVWGGVMTGLYSVGIATLGDRFAPSDLIAANALYITLYSAGSILGPVLSGIAMDLAPPDGLMWSFAAFAGAYVVIVGARIALRSDGSAQG